VTEPTASVVLAVHADPRARRTVEALKQQTMPSGALQIIVVENGSADLTDLRADPDITYLHFHRANSAAARNAGLDRAQGRYLLLTDADCIPDPTWARHLIVALTANGVAVAGGSIVKHAPRTWVQRNTITVVDGQTRASYLPASSLPYVAGANAAFDIALLRTVGGFDA
jgi:glycosyltransferase involved in cell wall biosynthesis